MFASFLHQGVKIPPLSPVTNLLMPIHAYTLHDIYIPCHLNIAMHFHCHFSSVYFLSGAKGRGWCKMSAQQPKTSWPLRKISKSVSVKKSKCYTRVKVFCLRQLCNLHLKKSSSQKVGLMHLPLLLKTAKICLPVPCWSEHRDTLGNIRVDRHFFPTIYYPDKTIYYLGTPLILGSGSEQNWGRMH